jgi:hypothetical protein
MQKLGDACVKQALEAAGGDVNSAVFDKEFKKLMRAAIRSTPFLTRCKGLWRKHVTGIDRVVADEAAVEHYTATEVDPDEIKSVFEEDEEEGNLLSSVRDSLELHPSELANSMFLEFVQGRPRAGSELIRRALGRAKLDVVVGEEAELIVESDQLNEQDQFGASEQDYEVENSLVEDGDVLRDIRSDSLRQSAGSLMTVQRSLEFDELSLGEGQVSVDTAIKKESSASGNQDEVSEIEEEEQTEEAENEAKINEEASEGGGSDDD